MKIYIKASKYNPLDEYIGKDVWIRVQYKENGSQKYSDDYLIKVLEKISDTKYNCATIFKPFDSSLPELTDRTDLRTTTLRAKGITISEPLETYTDEELFGESDYINKYEERKEPSATLEDISQFVGKDAWIELDLKEWGDTWVKFEDIAPDGTISFYEVPPYYVGHHYSHNPYTLEELTVEEIDESLHRTLWKRPLSRLGIKKRQLLGNTLTTDELIHAIID